MQKPGYRTSMSPASATNFLRSCLSVVLIITIFIPAKAEYGGDKRKANRSPAGDHSLNSIAPAGNKTGRPASFLPVTIFQPSDQPDEALNNDGQSIEVGVKFRTTQGGTISAIRYYKGTGTTGTHVGSLWTIAGTKLAEATFSSETSSGWQEVTLSTPVTIAAGTTYIVSIYSPSGHYASTSNYFTSAVTNGSIKALADDEDGDNGIYKYGASGFPNTGSTVKANYWVDVVFNPGEGGSGGGSISGGTNYIAKFTAANAVGNSILFDNGTSVGIGTATVPSGYKLAVAGGIIAEKLKVKLQSAGWPDYVFKPRYQLRTLKEVEEFIQKNNHLPDVPSADEVGRNGLDIGDSQAVLLRKIEELTLYLIEHNKQNEILEQKVKELEEKVRKLSQAYIK